MLRACPAPGLPPAGLTAFLLIGSLLLPSAALAGKADQLRRLVEAERYEQAYERGMAWLEADRAGPEEVQVRLLVQEAMYLRASSEDSQAGYVWFLRRFPDSPWSERAREQLAHRLFIDQILERPSPRSFRRFVELFPESTLVPEAVFREEELVWREVREEDTETAYRDFYRRYPGGSYAAACLARMAELEFFRVRRLDEPDGYLEFLRSYPDSPYTEEARSRSDDLVWERVLREDSVEAWRAYRQAFAGTDRAEEAYEREIELAWAEARREHSTEAYRSFQREYPESELALVAEEREWDLFHWQRDLWPGELQPGNLRSHRQPDGSWELYFDVRDAEGGYVGGLRKEHFAVYDAGFGAEIIELAGMESERPLDVVFVMDVTGSMREEIDGVKDGIIRFSEIMRLRSRDTRYGLVTFGDIIRGQYPGRGPLTGDVTEFQGWVAEQVADGGGDGPENPLDALYSGLRMGFRDDAQVVFVLVTDAPAHERDEVTKLSFAMVVPEVDRRAICAYTVTPTYPNYVSLAGSTCGDHYPLEGNFRSIFEEITQKISKQYRMVYRRPPDAPPVIGELDLKIRVRSDWAWMARQKARESGLPSGGAISSLALAQEGRLLVAGERGGLHCSEDGGVAWETCGSGLPSADAVKQLVVDRLDSETVWARTEGGGLWLSRDGGVSFSPASLDSGPTVAFAEDPETASSWLAHDGRRLWRRSADGNWKLATTWEPDKRAVLVESSTWDETKARAQERAVLVLDEDGGLWHSADAGRSFEGTDTTPWASEDAPAGFSFHPRREGLVFAYGSGGLHRSVDGGRSWRTVDLEGLVDPEVTVHEVLIDPTVRGWTLALTSEGVLGSDDMGRSWKRHESGLAEGAAVSHGSVSPDGKLVLATADGGSLYGLERVANREYVFSSVFFGSGSAVPARSLWPHLDELAVLLRGDEDLTLFVEGHTDTDGSEETNQRLSERRAEWVCDYLKEKRVRPEQLVSTGYGELRPLFDESRPGGKARNRRVELVLLSPHGELPLLEGME